LRAQRPLAWADGQVSAHRTAGPLLVPIWRGDFLTASPTRGAEARQGQPYARPGSLEAVEPSRCGFAPGDRGRDGFDESQGCYSIVAREGRVQLMFHPPLGSVEEPVLMIRGNWRGPVLVNVAGRAVRRMVRLEDGAWLAILPGWYDQAVPVEISGRLGQQGGNVTSP